ncbi:MAG: hypothetical protein JHC94_07335 [Acidimicrobiia bacterium]|nr:hypothetical protein [Acidimicrobiia bacterium]MBJ7514118.1 hypothetical protein [Acidimicrobiia bacterium]
MEEIKESADFIDPYQEGSGHDEEAVNSMRAEMEAMADIVNDEESWPAYIEEQVAAARCSEAASGKTWTAKDEEDCRSTWLHILEDERDNPLMTDLDTSPEFW